MVEESKFINTAIWSIPPIPGRTRNFLIHPKPTDVSDHKNIWLNLRIWQQKWPRGIEISWGKGIFTKIHSPSPGVWGFMLFWCMFSSASNQSLFCWACRRTKSVLQKVAAPRDRDSSHLPDLTIVTSVATWILYVEQRFCFCFVLSCFLVCFY